MAYHRARGHSVSVPPHGNHCCLAPPSLEFLHVTIIDSDTIRGLQYVLNIAVPDVRMWSLTWMYSRQDASSTGLLIDTERVYTEVNNDILGRYGKIMTWDIKAQLMGKPRIESATHLLSLFPGIDLTIDRYLTESQEKQDAKWSTVQLLPGVQKLIQHLVKYNVPIIVATASLRRNFVRKSENLKELFDYFQDNIVCADDVAGKTMGKPDPYIFLYAASVLGKAVGATEQCTEAETVERGKGLVFEEAVYGVQAGKRAGMSVVWVPDERLLDVASPSPYVPDETLTSIEHFKPEKWGLPPYDTK
ncbi:HAD-like domain-containing protein [Suillus fuscotomentosus]|uniref:HAD-like domain-containing protein n=1 Tax=Suillus fuscotomentosus TaxID=1912939 RepID=A0AAD4E6F0_9AGAM|nr:HAD-like domain-containing protein [Suillus fuscotomentosus]KAG1900516.1 HAD-like domain-containing protein [Suillus fuscotomentosus]